MYMKDQRVRTKRALYKGGRGIAGLGGSPSDCGAGQIYDPYYQFAGITGQCVTQAQSDANKAANPGQYPGGQSNGGFSDVLSATIGAVGKIFGSQPPTVIQAPASSGISPTTLLVLGGLGLGAVLILSRRGS